MMAAEQDESKLSLLSLEEDLTCSICLSTFDCPVTIPCGHNFCHDCLLSSWKDSYSCPQCRTLFESKPELKKNTVLSTVADTFRSRSTKEEIEPEEDVVRCDTCMVAEAAQTCLTCMASFCEEHLRPHRENPNFRLHQLSQPIGDLSEHICSEHHKLMELFCTKHGRLICSFCLQQVHKGCSFISPEEQRNLKQTEFREKLGLLDSRIDRTYTVVLQMNDMQGKLTDAAENRKAALAAAYQQMREMLDHDEQLAQHEVDCELEASHTKLRDLMNRFTDNNEKMQKAKEEISDLLSRSQTPAFLQASFELPKVVKFEPHTPRVSVDSKRVMAAQTFTSAMQESLVQILSQPFEARRPLQKLELDTSTSDKKQAPSSGPVWPENVASWIQSFSAPLKPAEGKPQTRSKSPGHPLVAPVYQPAPFPVNVPLQPTWTTSQPFQQDQQFSRPLCFPGKKTSELHTK
uniref:Tripartite motif containing 25 n=2 Tax=Nothobranchius rachovii TaxID=451742 RepID=A0A1A8QS93_9TELE